MSKTKYYDADGAPINLEEWATFRLDQSYCIRREYSNGRIMVKIEWLGKVTNPDTWEEYWPMYELKIWANTGDVNAATWLLDGESGDKFGSLEAANAAMDLFLSKWTESRYVEDDDGRKTFVEEGNILAPPPPPDLDSPEKPVVIGDLGSDVW